MLLGAHVSIAGGLENAPLNAAAIDCEVFQMFTRSPQGGFVPPCDEAVAEKFQDNCRKHGQKEWYVHAPYFINFASKNPRVKHGSMSVIQQELERSSLLGAKYLITHLGSYKDLGEKAGLAQLADALQKTLDGYKGKTELLVETSAGAGDIIGDTFEELAAIIFHPKLKKFDLGLCYDTQHTFVSGYDIRTAEAVDETLKKLDKIIGLKKLKLFHCNDSITDFASRKDRHTHIGEGKIGLGGFKNLLSDKHLKDINFILETESDGVAEDIKKLKNIRDNKN